MNPALTDEVLVRRHCEGDGLALPALMERHRGSLMTFLRRTVPDEQLAEEVFVDTWLAIHRAAPQWRPEAKFRTFLFRVARNRAVSALRTRGEAGRRKAVLYTSGRHLRLVPGGADPERSASARQALTRLEIAIAALPEPRRCALLLHHVEGLSYPEIADVMECPLGTVKTHLHQARKTLKELLSAAAEGAAS